MTRHFERAAKAIACAFTIAASACSGPPSAPIAESPAAKPIDVTLLYTSDEHGWVLPFDDRGTQRGGAAEVLARWIAVEGHCPAGGCADPPTLVLSGGDNFTGPAISTYFAGAPMAEAMARMGYAASAFGNHELDFGRDKFSENIGKSRLKYLAANIVPEGSRLTLPAFAVFERRGVKIGVVGLATEETLHTAMASRFAGARFGPPEPALDRAVASAWAAGADAVVAIAHECPPKLAPIIARHPEWRLSFVGAGHCHKRSMERAGDVAVVSPGWRLEAYARVALRVDRSKPARERVIAADASIVEVARAQGEGALPADPEIANAVAAYKTRLDRELGVPIGYAATAIDKDAPELGRWITRAIREETGADVAIVNTGGIRQSLPAGTITKATVWSIIPFDNKVVELELRGQLLLQNLANKEAIAAGAVRSPGGGWALANGDAIDSVFAYKVATLDFLFLGGAHFAFEQGTRRLVDHDVDWRDMVIRWTEKQRTTPDSPLDQRLREAPRPKPKR